MPIKIPNNYVHTLLTPTPSLPSCHLALRKQITSLKLKDLLFLKFTFVKSD